MSSDENNLDVGSFKLTKENLESALKADPNLMMDFESKKEFYFQQIDNQLMEAVNECVENFNQSPNLDQFIENELKNIFKNDKSINQEDIEESLLKAASKFVDLAIKSIKTSRK